jgi:hypothetical protein
MPEVSLALCAVGGELVAGGQLKSCDVLPAVRLVLEGNGVRYIALHAPLIQ